MLPRFTPTEVLFAKQAAGMYRVRNRRWRGVRVLEEAF